MSSADFVFHLAGTNRPIDDHDFVMGNIDYTKQLLTAIAGVGRAVPVLFASSTQATLNNPYGRSKRGAEDLILEYGISTGAPVHVFRLTNVFGKWCRPDYNSVVATFCECGGQASGGNFSADWRSVPDIAHIGFPIAEAYPNAEIVITKHENTGGLV